MNESQSVPGDIAPCCAISGLRLIPAPLNCDIAHRTISDGARPSQLDTGQAARAESPPAQICSFIYFHISETVSNAQRFRFKDIIPVVRVFWFVPPSPLPPLYSGV